jgi:hypothetical protein
LGASSRLSGAALEVGFEEPVAEKKNNFGQEHGRERAGGKGKPH